MAKVGRNDPCPCGSGKKYKNCHWKQDQVAAPLQATAPKPQLVPTFDHLIANYHAEPIIALLGVLQLLPANHGREALLEDMARRTLLQRRANDERPFASWQRLNAVIGSMGHFDDEPTALFTENVIFTEGNYTVYPGIYVRVATIVNELLECIFLRENDLPKAFVKDVNDGAGLLLLLSDTVARRKGHIRYMAGSPSPDHKIQFPEYEDGIYGSQTIRFSRQDIEDICALHHYNVEVIKEFTLPLNDLGLKNEDPDLNPVGLKPLIETPEDFILYMPTTVVNSVMEFIYRKANQHGCHEAVLEMLCRNQFHNTGLALEKTGWVLTNIVLPKLPAGLPIRERVFQFDNQKFGYLCFVETVGAALAKPGNEQSLEKRMLEVIEFLQSLNNKQEFQVFTLFVLAETGKDGFFFWHKPSAGHQTIAFQYGELMALAYTKGTNGLSLWKFAKTYTRTSERVRIMAPGGTLDAYAIYNKNSGSLLHSDEARPFGGMMIVPGSSNDFQRDVQQKRDEHAVLVFNGKVPGYTKVVRQKEFAPIYTDKFVYSEHRMVIENFTMPIWITNHQSETHGDITWAQQVCEAVAFWFQKMEQSLMPYLEGLTLIQFEIEVIVDESLLRTNSFEIKEMDVSTLEIGITVEAPRIKLHLPFDFLYAIRLADNTADKLLMRAAIQGLVEYTAAGGKQVIPLTKEQIELMVNEALKPAGAKMLLFSDVSHNVRLDTRNLPYLRYIQDADVSYVLDNLVSYLPADYLIPVEIPTRGQKTQLCDDLVKTLIAQIKNRIAVFEGEGLLEWLIKMNERCVQERELREIHIPAKIACFSNIEKEVQEFREKGENLVTTSLALRTLIEWVALNIPTGTKWPNFDDVDELMALTNQVINWGATSEALRFDLSDFKMGLLPSGRIGTEKKFEQEVLQPYHQAKMESDVHQYVEEFEKNYVHVERSTAKPTATTKILDEAFKSEFELTLTRLSQIIGVLIDEGFKTAKACTKLEESVLVACCKAGIADIADEEIAAALKLLTLIRRPEIGKPPKGYRNNDIFPWHYSRPLSYLRRPLVKLDRGGETYYLYGYRHLMMYIDNLYFLLFSGKLPEGNSENMRRWIASVLSQKGKPFRNEVKNWFQANTNFVVIDYEVSIRPGGNLNADKDYGDIDLLVIDTQAHIIYPVECKASIGARNIHEMKTEMDIYLGRSGKEGKAKVAKHVQRDVWLKQNQALLSQFVTNPQTYTIRSFILTKDDIPLPYLKAGKLPLPFRSFAALRRNGTAVLDDL